MVAKALFQQTCHLLDFKNIKGSNYMSLGVSCEASEMCSFHLGGQEELFVQSLQNSEDRGRANVDLLARLHN